MKIWVCCCGFQTSCVEKAVEHTRDNGHMMRLKDVPDTARYSMKVGA